jgi:alpha-glucosidase
MFEALRFWLDRGVDGFRVDVIWLLIKDAAFRDNPLNPAYQPTQAAINRCLSLHNADQPEIHDLIAEMRSLLDRYPDRVLIGEIYLPLERLVAYYGKDLSGAHLPFNFALIHTAWNAAAIANLINEYENLLPLGGWPNWVLGNHDQPRIAARVGAAQARVAAMLLLMLRGTPTMYYGDELGLARVEIPPDLAQDPWERNEPGLGVSRDPWRTPFHWDHTTHAGFTRGRPWLPLDAEWPTCNVQNLRAQPQSILWLYRRLIKLRLRHPALSIGGARIIAVVDDVLLFERSHEGERLVVALNLGADDRELKTAGFKGAMLLLSTHLDREGAVSKPVLRGNEGVVFRPTSPPQ